MSLHKIYTEAGKPKSFTFWEKIKFFLYTGVWPTEIKMVKVDPSEFQGIPKPTNIQDWVEIEYQDPTDINHYE